MRRNWWFLGSLVVMGLGAGCTSVLGDFSVDEEFDAGRHDAGGSKDAAADGPSGTDAGADAADANPDVRPDAPLNGCKDPSHAQVLPGKMFGCPGRVFWEHRNDLCSGACTACPSSRWASTNGVALPEHDYWTDDILDFNGANNDCSVFVSSTVTCTAFAPDSGVDGGWVPSPMRVCVPGDGGWGMADPEGNTCNWSNCGYDASTPNAYFGGCGNNPTAGTLCCCP